MSAIMVGFHDVDGVAMHSHRALVRDLLKTTWGFAGVVDQRLGRDRPAGRTRAWPATCATRPVRPCCAGVDLDMASGAYRTYLPDLVASGEVGLDLLDDAVRRVLRLKFRLGAVRRARARRRAP